ncbi:MAG: VOC family protein [Erysipelotrichaceae bacterium]|nr:VOC family protein [Erysipelotrichaceae bacterium]MDD3810166.1 VOC family protein [Erysipelotrichaceae bacterium]
MEFKSIMHVSFFTDQMDVMRDFYENKLGLKTKIVTRARLYEGLNRGAYSEVAKIDPDRIIIVYIEIAPGQFIELFPKNEGQKEHDQWNERVGYSHFALLVDDIEDTRDQLVAAGVEIDTPLSKGPSNTWQMWVHDPDGNKFEIMQYTPESFQLVGSIMESK